MTRVNHQEGQLRAELFDKFVERLLRAEFPAADVTSKIVGAEADDGTAVRVNIDFIVLVNDIEIVVETKAPYTSSAAYGVNRAIRHLKDTVSRLRRKRLQRAILALATELPAQSRAEVEIARAFCETQDVIFELWDAPTLAGLTAKHFGGRVATFSLAELRSLVSEATEVPRVAPSSLRELPTGEHDDVIVLTADFCSFSRFVHASSHDAELIASVMGRFYRETREAVVSHAGIVDKYMGDGILAYWFGVEGALRMEACVERLIGIAINLAEEWQDQVDLAVEPKGMRIGAALGRVQFIPERPGSSIIHAIGESINVAARLQAAAAPNSLVISNRLRSRFFDQRDDFEQVGTLSLKNIGDVIAWRKSYGA